MKFLCTYLFLATSLKKNTLPKNSKKLKHRYQGDEKSIIVKQVFRMLENDPILAQYMTFFSPAIYCNLAWLSTIINRVHFLVSHYANSSSIFAKILRGGRWHVQG